MIRLNVDYGEFRDFVAAKFHQQVEFDFVDERTVGITANVKIGIIPLSVIVNLKVGNVSNDEIALSYGGKYGVDLIITGVLTFIKNKLSEYTDAVVYNDDKTITVRLSKIGKLESALKYLSLNDIRFNESAVIIEANLL